MECKAVPGGRGSTVPGGLIGNIVECKDEELIASNEAQARLIGNIVECKEWRRKGTVKRNQINRKHSGM